MSAQHTPEFARWLEEATADLPEIATNISRAELVAHYEDAITEYLEEGMTLAEAQSGALADLGVAENTGRGFKDVHRGRAHYKLAALASMSILAITFLLPTMVYSGLVGKPEATRWAFVAGDLLLAILTSFTLLALRRLLVWRFDRLRLGPVMDVIIATYVVWLAADVASIVVFDLTLYIGSMRALSDGVSTFDTALIALATAAQIVMAFTGLVVAGALWLSEDNLYGIGKPLAICFVLMVIPIGTASLALNAGKEIAYQILSLVVMLAHATLWPVLTLLFVRTVFRPRDLRPARFA